MAEEELTIEGRFCEICGGPLPCDKPPCLDAFQAQAEYWEVIRAGDDVWADLDRLRDWKAK